MTTTPTVRVIENKPRLSLFLAAELRAAIAREGITQREVSRRLGRQATWLNSRISATAAKVDLTIEEVDTICFVIGTDVETVLMEALRARRDSNPQPSDLEPAARPVLRLVPGRPQPYPQVGGKPTLPPKLLLVGA